MSVFHLMAGCLPWGANWRLKNLVICSGRLTAIFSTEFGANLALTETSDQWRQTMDGECSSYILH